QHQNASNQVDDMAGSPRHVIHLVRGILMLHAIQDVASFLEPFRGTTLAGRILGSVLLIFGIAHVIRGFLKALDGLLEPWIGDRSGAPAIGAAARLSVGLLPL